MIIDHGFRSATAGPGCSYPVARGGVSGDPIHCGALEEQHERVDGEYAERNANLSAEITAAARRRLDTTRVEDELRVLEGQLMDEKRHLERTQHETSSDLWLLKLTIDDITRARENLVMRRLLWTIQHPPDARG